MFLWSTHTILVSSRVFYNCPVLNHRARTVLLPVLPVPSSDRDLKRFAHALSDGRGSGETADAAVNSALKVRC